jgi:hypothetical protein
MDWQRAISRNRDALIAIIAALMRSLGLVEGGSLTTLPRHLYRKALFIIRPAEAAVRRLIMMAAYEMQLRGVILRQSRSTGERHPVSFPNAANFAPSFNLIDPLKPFGPTAPDYSFFADAFGDKHGPDDQKPIPAAALGQRLLALKHALDNIQRQARRLTRWYAQRDRALKQMLPHRLSPLRPGPPPGSRMAKLSVKHSELAGILLECHLLAIYGCERKGSP